MKNYKLLKDAKTTAMELAKREGYKSQWSIALKGYKVFEESKENQAIIIRKNGTASASNSIQEDFILEAHKDLFLAEDTVETITSEVLHIDLVDDSEEHYEELAEMAFEEAKAEEARYQAQIEECIREAEDAFLELPSFGESNTVKAEEDCFEDLEKDTFDAISQLSNDSKDTFEMVTEEAMEETPKEMSNFSLTFKTENWTAEKLRNLVFTIFSKGDLLNKVTGGNFGAKKDWCEAYKKDDLLTWQNFASANNEGEIRGILFEHDQVTFVGCKEVFNQMSQEQQQAIHLLFKAIMDYLADDKHQRVQIKETLEENEKYAFRNWITRLGWKDQSPEHKKARAFLYSKLKGHVAFRTPEDEAKWKIAQSQRMAMRKPTSESISERFAELEKRNIEEYLR